MAKIPYAGAERKRGPAKPAPTIVDRVLSGSEQIAEAEAQLLQMILDEILIRQKEIVVLQGEKAVLERRLLEVRNHPVYRKKNKWRRVNFRSKRKSSTRRSPS